MATERDQIDDFLEEWAPELPKLDLEVEGIVERIQFLQHHLKRLLGDTLAEHGLSHGEWGVLGMLKRPGPPYRRTPGQLARHASLSTGAMTNRLDRLEQAGLVRRLPDADDRRSIQVELTEAGHEAWQASVGAQGQKEELVVSALPARDRRQLNELLRRLVLAFEAQHGPIARGKDNE